MGQEAASQGMSWHTAGMALPISMALQQLGKGGAFPQHQHNALHFHGISGGRQGTFHPPSTPSDVWQGARSTDSVRKQKPPIILSDEVPQTLQLQVKSCFNKDFLR